MIAWNATVGSTSQRDRLVGCRLDSAPMTGPLTMPNTTSEVMTSDAAAGREALTRGEEREPPQQHERGAREGRGEVRPEAEARRRVAP